MKLLFPILAFLIAPSLWATSYTVKAAGGGSFTTVQGCATVMVGGDTCTVFAGTYNETVTPANSGSVGNLITFTTNTGDTVTIRDFVLTGLSYISISGTAANPLTVTGRITWTTFTTHDVFQYITNNAGASGPCFGGSGWYSGNTPTSYNQFLNLTLAYCGGLTNNNNGAIQLEGHFNLFDSITCSNQQACITLSGTYNVIRNSTFGPTSIGVIASNHSQPIESSIGSGDIAGGTQHLLAENNTSLQWRGGNSHATILNTDTTGLGSTSNVLRFNSGIASGSYTVQIYASLNNYFYNNSFSNTQLDNSPKDLQDFTFYQNGTTTTGTRAINNIVANTTRPATTDWCIYADGVVGTSLFENHNLCFMTSYSGTWNGPTIASSNTYDASDIFNSDPKFVDPLLNLHVQAGSPAIAAGGPLTTAVGAGVTSTALTVVDAGFFFANVGMPGSYAADYIRIGAATTVQIASINYGTNVITLASPQSWANNAAIYLYKNSSGTIVLNGASPNIGFDQGSAGAVTPAAPSKLGVLLMAGKIELSGRIQ
jgi:hypothetical protein